MHMPEVGPILRKGELVPTRHIFLNAPAPSLALTDTGRRSNLPEGRRSCQVQIQAWLGGTRKACTALRTRFGKRSKHLHDHHCRDRSHHGARVFFLPQLASRMTLISHRIAEYEHSCGGLFATPLRRRTRWRISAVRLDRTRRQPSTAQERGDGHVRLCSGAAVLHHTESSRLHVAHIGRRRADHRGLWAHRIAALYVHSAQFQRRRIFISDAGHVQCTSRRCCSTGSSLRCVHYIARRGGMWKAREKARGCRRHARRCGDAEGTREGVGCGRHARRGGMRKAREKGRDAEGTRKGAGRGRHMRSSGTRKEREKKPKGPKAGWLWR